MAGIYFVTLPIGNSKDITLRAIESIKSASCIYAEDTRVFKQTMKFCEIDINDKKVISFHDHSSEQQVESIISRAIDEDIVFVSDAGSPVISDPAYPLIKKAIEKDVEIHSIGGVSSVICALELSALPSTPFHFHGFLARDKSKFKADLSSVGFQYGTHIFFEGKSRVLSTLKTISEMYPDLNVALCRELTKEHESIYRFCSKDFEAIKDEITMKGEFVILIHNDNKSESNQSSEEVKELAQKILKSGAKPKLLSKLIAQITNTNSKEVYEQLNKFGRQ